MKRRPRTRAGEGAALVSFFAVVAFVFALPIFGSIHNWGIQDWDQHLFQHGVPRATLLDYHQVPLWNPYNWSGVPLLANPESRVLSPSFLLDLIFGEVVGLKLEILVFLVVGMLGAYRLLRHYGAGGIGAAVGGCVFMLNSGFALHVCVGHVWILNVAYLPWAFLYYLRARDDSSQAIFASAIVALMIFGGGVYPFMIALLLFAIHSALEVAFCRKQLWRHAKLLLVIGLQTLSLAAIKLLPTAELMWRHPRATEATDGYSFTALLGALFSRSQTLASAFADRPGDFNSTPIHEGLYIGVVALLPLAFGLLRHARRQRILVLVCGVFLWIILGDRIVPSLWGILHTLPGFDNMRMIQRFGVALILGLSVFIGLGLHDLQRCVREWSSSSRIATAVAAGLGLVVLCDLMLVNSPIFADAFPIAPIPIERSEHFEQLKYWRRYDAAGPRRNGSNPRFTTTSGLYPAFLSNRGVIRGYEVVPIPSSATPSGDPSYRGEAYLDGTAGDVELESWSPNALVLAVRSTGSGLLVINQNFDPGWGAVIVGEGGRERRLPISEHGLLALPVSAADRRVELRYLPGSFLIGAGASGIAWIAAVVAVRNRTRRSTADPARS